MNVRVGTPDGVYHSEKSSHRVNEMFAVRARPAAGEEWDRELLSGRWLAPVDVFRPTPRRLPSHQVCGPRSARTRSLLAITWGTCARTTDGRGTSYHRGCGQRARRRRRTTLAPVVTRPPTDQARRNWAQCRFAPALGVLCGRAARRLGATGRGDLLRCPGDRQ